MKGFTAGRPHPQSPGEQILAPLLPGFRSNIYRVCRHVDFLHEEVRVIVEVDGYTFHSDPDVFHRDRDQDVKLAEQGYLVLRFTHGDVVRDPQQVAARIMAVTRQRAEESTHRINQREMLNQLAYAVHEHAVERLPATRVNRLTRSIGNYFKDQLGPDIAGDVVKGLNREMKKKFGAARQRSDEQAMEALHWLDDWWTHMRAQLRIRSTDIPSWDAIPCETCGRYLCEGIHCWMCQEPLTSPWYGRDTCWRCADGIYETCDVCLTVTAVTGLNAHGACQRCEEAMAGR